MARKLGKILDAEEVYRMAKLGCPIVDIAQKFQVSRQYIESNYLSDYLAGFCDLKEEMREAQILCAKQDIGNARMLVWLGMHYLDQKEITKTEKVDEIDIILNELRKRADCSNYPQNSSEASARQQPESTSGLDPSVAENLMQQIGPS